MTTIEKSPAMADELETIIKLAVSDGEYIGRHGSGRTPQAVIDLRTGATSERVRAMQSVLARYPSPYSGAETPVAWRVSAGANCERHLFENKRDAQLMRDELEENGWTDVALVSLYANPTTPPRDAERETIEVTDPMNKDALAAYADVVRQGDAIYRQDANDIQDRRAIRTFVDRFRPQAALTSIPPPESTNPSTGDQNV